MPFALITIGVLIFFTALNNTAGALGKQLYKDLFSEDGGFVYWVAGIVIVGLIGYIPTLKKPSDLFMVLIILAMLLQNKGFFSQLQQGLQAGPSGSSTGTSLPNTGSGSTNPITGASTGNAPNTGLFSGPLGAILLQQQAASGAEPVTTPLPGSNPFGAIGSA